MKWLIVLLSYLARIGSKPKHPGRFAVFVDEAPHLIAIVFLSLMVSTSILNRI
jgi:hypothetical protein